MNSNSQIIPYYDRGNIVAECPICNRIVNWEYQQNSHHWGHFRLSPSEKEHIHFVLLKCAGCGQGGLAIVEGSSTEYPAKNGKLLTNYPITTSHLNIPDKVPENIVKEFREAEGCLAYGLYRAGSALFRSVLEKTLKANGFKKGYLEEKIKNAADIGLITKARKQKVDQEIRVLGNEVVHDDYKEIPRKDVLAARHYSQRILEDLYDDRAQTEIILTANGIQWDKT